MSKIKAPIKDEFVSNVMVAQHMLDKFKEELQRCDDFVVNDKVYRNTRKSKLNMYRKIINDELLFIENNYGCNCYSGVQAPIEDCKDD